MIIENLAWLKLALTYFLLEKYIKWLLILKERKLIFAFKCWPETENGFYYFNSVLIELFMLGLLKCIRFDSLNKALNNAKIIIKTNINSFCFLNASQQNWNVIIITFCLSVRLSVVYSHFCKYSLSALKMIYVIQIYYTMLKIDIDVNI